MDTPQKTRAGDSPARIGIDRLIDGSIIVNPPFAEAKGGPPPTVEPLGFSAFTFKPAETADEFEQIHRLNYETFVREVPQHADNGTGCLVDRFHDKNRYFLAQRAGRIVGMVATHDEPPFAVAEKMADPAILDHLVSRPLEVRLLAVHPCERGGPICVGLLWMVYQSAKAGGYSHLLISGLRQRRAMYEQIGFRALGPAVLAGRAWYIPMVLDLADMPQRINKMIRRLSTRIRRLSVPDLWLGGFQSGINPLELVAHGGQQLAVGPFIGVMDLRPDLLDPFLEHVVK